MQDTTKKTILRRMLQKHKEKPIAIQPAERRARTAIGSVPFSVPLPFHGT